ncbi:DUF6786 family protein [Marinoscillum furvescens]|uniref:Lipoprotein n=1 Tax=Marinoscillum furvescens DSM 4134 TaxID=1122208 RepID=A0A3D9L6F3_MARFU|nr:DUF6786 family protein [Marinoscillum furvescens]REE00157.1 hypothetical protein C7460_10696 [Marinoscillum furvescens DSM 4134]
MKINIITPLVLACVLGMIGCTPQKSDQQTSTPEAYDTYADDVDFMSKYTDILNLNAPDGQGRVAVSPALQGRVMTSSARGREGRSFGWINRELFASGDTMEHINVYGGEERFWLGPEGGQYSIFFENGADFNLDNWYTPRLIDLEPFEILSQTKSSAVFTKNASLTNYSGFEFDMAIERKVEVLAAEEVFEALGVAPQKELSVVAYQTTNSLTNVGNQDWEKESGLLSIWLLGMFNHSPATTVVIPFKPGSAEDLGPAVNDAYFGKVPEDRLVVRDSVLFFSGDGQFRSKIGLSPQRAKDVLGSYDAANGILTIVKYNQPEGVTDYVNSMWEIQDAPYAGDVVNSYNDGPPEPGAKPLGPFYELETSSPALALKSGEAGTHVQLTCHFEGDEKALNRIAVQVLGVSLVEIESVLNKEK